MTKNTVHHHDPDMPMDLHHAAKMEAIKEGLPLKEWIRLAMAEKLDFVKVDWQKKEERNV